MTVENKIHLDILYIEGNNRKALLVTETMNGVVTNHYIVDQARQIHVEDRSKLLKVKDVVGYENRFMISERGDLISKTSKTSRKLLSQTFDENGYLTHATKIGGREGKDVLLRIHRLVAEAFIPNPDNKPEVNHLDGIKINNYKSNLDWVTGSENIKHSYGTGLNKVKYGFDSPSTKLTADSIQQINEFKDKLSSRKVAAKFGLNKDTVLRVWSGNIFTPN